MTGNPLPVIFFGGTFDPPHLGHKKLAEFVCNHMSYETLMVAPAYSPPHKSSAGLVAYEHRLQMTRLLFDPGPEKDAADDFNRKLNVSDLESKLPGPSYTYLTLRQLRKTTDAPIYIMVGMDMYKNLYKWSNYNELLENYRFVVLSRYMAENANTSIHNASDSPPDDFREILKSRDDVFIDNPLWDISSNELREAYAILYASKMNSSAADSGAVEAAGQIINKWIPAPVHEYITGNQLYNV